MLPSMYNSITTEVQRVRFIKVVKEKAVSCAAQKYRNIYNILKDTKGEVDEMINRNNSGGFYESKLLRLKRLEENKMKLLRDKE